MIGLTIKERIMRVLVGMAMVFAVVMSGRSEMVFTGFAFCTLLVANQVRRKRAWKGLL